MFGEKIDKGFVGSSFESRWPQFEEVESIIA